MKKAYTVLEMVITIAVLSALTAAIFNGSLSPRRWVLSQALKAQVKQIFDDITISQLYGGKNMLVILTPWSLWRDNQKLLDLPVHGDMHWHGLLSRLEFKPDGSVNAFNEQSQALETDASSTLWWKRTPLLSISVNHHIVNLKGG